LDVLAQRSGSCHLSWPSVEAAEEGLSIGRAYAPALSSHFVFLFPLFAWPLSICGLFTGLKPTCCIFKDVNQPTKGGSPTMTTAISRLGNIFEFADLEWGRCILADAINCFLWQQ